MQHNSHTVVEAVRPGACAREGFRMEGVGSALHVRWEVLCMSGQVFKSRFCQVLLSSSSFLLQLSSFFAFFFFLFNNPPPLIFNFWIHKILLSFYFQLNFPQPCFVPEPQLQSKHNKILGGENKDQLFLLKFHQTIRCSPSNF